MNRPAPATHRLSLAALALCAATLTGCGAATPPPGSTTTSSTSSAPPAGKSYSLGCTIPTFNHPFFVAMKKGLDEEATAAGATINVVDGKNDAQAQLTAIDGFVVQKVDAIVLCPTETETLGPGVEKANSANIPVITVNRTVAKGNAVTYVGADDVEGGRLQGQALMEALPKGGKILLMLGVMNSSPQRDREKGLLEALEGHSEYQIIQRAPYDFDRTKGVTVMETALTQWPKGKLDAVVAQSDDGALAAADVCGQKGRTELKLIGFNGESDAFDAIKAGKIYATVLQDAETQGREAVKATLAHLKGETVKNPMITPLYSITQKNINEHQPAWQSSKS